jgi:hypothetical protein
LKTKFKQLYCECYEKDDEGNTTIVEENVQILIDYINNFACIINYPHCYGWRNDDNTFEMRNKDKVTYRIKYGFNNTMQSEVSWCHSDNQLMFNRMVFEVDASKVKTD